MSNTENNKTDNVLTNKETKTETGPGNEPSSRNNIIMPSILLLVSAAVIIPTLYDDEDKSLTTQTVSEESATNLSGKGSQHAEMVSATVNTVGSKAITTKAENIDSATENTAAVTNSEQKKLHTAFTEDTSITDELTTTAKSNKSSPLNNTKKMPNNVQIDSMAASAKRHHVQNISQADSVHTPYQQYPYANRQSYEQARQRAVARSQEYAKKHKIKIQRHREAYEQEMRLRRHHAEAARLAAIEKAKNSRQERGSQIAETRKTVYKNREQNRYETSRKLREMHKRISQIHSEIHQMIRDSYQPRKSSAPVQIQGSSKEEI